MTIVVESEKSNIVEISGKLLANSRKVSDKEVLITYGDSEEDVNLDFDPAAYFLQEAEKRNL
jgi:hypothetical protein